MNFIFKPEKLTPELTLQVAEALAKHTENISRKKYTALWQKIDSLNSNKPPEDVLRRRKTRRVIYGIFLIAVGIFLVIPGLVKPKELLVPLIVGAFSLVNGIFAVLLKRTEAERFEKSAKKLMARINESLKSGDTVIFSEEAVFENGAVLMEYDAFDEIIETRSILFIFDGAKALVLRKIDLVNGDFDEFSRFLHEKTIKA